MKISMVTCWYSFRAAANYANNLIKALTSISDTKVNVVSFPCRCHYKKNYSGNKILASCYWINLPYIRYSGHNRLLNRLRYILQELIDVVKGVVCIYVSRYDEVVHYQQAEGSFGFVPLCGIVGLNIFKKKIIVTVHEIDAVQVKLPFLNKLYNYTKAVVVHAQETKDILLRLGVEEKKIHIIFHGVEIPELCDLNRTEITFMGNPAVLDKGFEDVIQALKIIKERGQMVVVSIYGMYTQEQKDSIVKIAQLSGVDDRLKWGGFLDDKNFFRKFQESMFTIIPYRKSHGSDILVRSMASATPVIATNIGGIPDYLVDSGELVPVSDPVRLAEAILKMQHDADYRKKCGNRARQRAVELLSWDAIAKKTFELYNCTCPENSPTISK